MRKRLREGQLDEREIEIELVEPRSGPDILTPPGMEEMAEQLRGMFAQIGGQRPKARKVRIAEAMRLLCDEEAGKRVNEDEIRTQAITNAEQNRSEERRVGKECRSRWTTYQ